jgi:F-box protein 9
MNSDESNPELESFRAQWKAEVQAKHAVPGPSRQQQQHQQNRAAAGPSTATRTARAAGRKGNPPPPTKKPLAQDYDEDYVPVQPFDEAAGITPATPAPDGGLLKAAEQGEPASALEHYEKAVEKEVAGNLGDSLRLYRKAFRVCHA